MVTCRCCGGEGGLRSLDPYEEERGILDPCYHCGGSGSVDEDTADADEVEDMLMSLAYDRAYEWRRAVDSDPEGEGFAFRAAESGLSTYDYLTGRAYVELVDVQARYESMTETERAVLLAWHRGPSTRPHDAAFGCDEVDP